MALASDFNQLLKCCFWFYIDALIITVSGRILTGKLKSLSSKQKMPTLIGRYLKPLLTLLAWGKEACDWGPHHRKIHDSRSCCHPQSVTWYRKKKLRKFWTLFRSEAFCLYLPLENPGPPLLLPCQQVHGLSWILPEKGVLWNTTAGFSSANRDACQAAWMLAIMISSSAHWPCTHQKVVAPKQWWTK